MSFSKMTVNFNGAYFRKVQSSVSIRWVGIETKLVLPTPEFDPARAAYLGDTGHRGSDHTAGPLDRPSIYVGGNGTGFEVDCGLVWERVWRARSHGTFTDRDGSSDGGNASHRFFTERHTGQLVIRDATGAVRSEGDAAEGFLAGLECNFAFRPFIRTTQPMEWITPQPPGSAHDRYFYPGEQIVMTVKVVGSEELELSIEVPGKPDRSYVRRFHQKGFGVGKMQSFKRVASIDQFFVKAGGVRKGNEKNSVIQTSTRLEGLHYERATMLTQSGNKVAMAGDAFIEVMSTELEKRYSQVFSAQSQEADGGELLTIEPNAGLPVLAGI